MGAALAGVAAVGVSGTFAWFQVSAQTNYSAVDTETGTLSAGVTNPNVGCFTFVLDDLDASASDKTVDLTDASGNSYVYTTTGTTNKMPVVPANPTCEWSGLTWTVSYSGPSDTAAKIQMEWNELIGRFPTANVTVTSDAGNTHTARFGDTNSGAGSCSSASYACATNVALSTISWSVAPTETGSGTNVFEVSQDITSKLTHTGFATALTGTDTNEGTAAAGTHGITVATSLNAA